MGADTEGTVSQGFSLSHLNNLAAQYHYNLLTFSLQVGEAETGYARNAEDDSAVEGERSWTWMEEMAQIDHLNLPWREMSVV
jgi:hypothetical protein